MSAPSAPLGTPDLRKQAEAAFEAGDLNQAKSLAADLARRTHLGPWEHFTLGRIALAAGDAKGAVTRLETALAARPGEGALLIELASAYAARKRWREAADTLVRALPQRSNVAALHERHATYLRNAGDAKAANAALERALDLEPTSASALTQKGEWRMADGDEKAARVWFDRPVDADSGSLAALSNLALLEEKACHLDAAIRLLKQVQGTPQDEARAHHRSGLLLLAQSMFAEGWPAYAARLKTKAYVSWQHLVEAPYWSGEDLSAKHLLVWTDQGLGEQILTAGFFPELVSLAEQVTIACDPRLVPLFKRCFAGMTVMSLNDLKDDTATRSAIGVQATISELGAQLRSAPDRFPAAGPYLLPDPVRVAALRARLSEQADGKPLVGISWRSANPLAGDAKSTSLAEHWGGVLKRDDVRFVSLQYGDTADELAAFEQTAAVSILRIGELDMTRDVDGFAALTAAMDAVLSTSNTTVHVAGALGKRVTAILPPAYVRPWYWFDRGDTSLWYPAVKLVRSDGDWRAAVQVAAETLDATALR
jgi:tetratricopeptide (TPR) repeat protein